MSALTPELCKFLDAQIVGVLRATGNRGRLPASRRHGRSSSPSPGRRYNDVHAALVGALLVINIDLVLPPSIAVIAASGLAAHWLSNEGSDWANPGGGRQLAATLSGRQLPALRTQYWD
jgi:hypothetical protein